MADIVDVNTLFGPLPAASADLSVDGLLELMQRHNVQAACTLSTLGMVLDPTVGNAATRAACAEQTQLLPVATLNPTMFFGDTTALASLPELGFRLLRFFPAEQGWQINYAPFHWLMRGVEETGLPVMVNIANPGDISELSRALASYTGAVILSRVDRYTLAEAVVAMLSLPNWYVEISRLLAPGCMRLAVDCVGPDRILFGTGAPARPVASALHTLQYAELDEAAVAGILGANARRVLNLA